MDNKKIDVQLAVEVKDEIVLAHLHFTNVSTEQIRLDTWAIFADKKIRNDYFKIFDEKNKEVDYTGMLVKRMFRPEDYIVFNAGEKIEASIEIQSVYELLKGKKYIINYFTYHPASLDRGLIQLESNTVEFSY
jgi:hypothetical protein